MSQVPCVYRQDAGTIDHTPESAVTAGDVVVLGTRLITIALVDIAAAALGALATSGLFGVPKVNGAVTKGAALYWDADGDPEGGDAGTGAFTTNSALGPFAGFAAAAAAETDEKVDLYLCSMDAASTTLRTNLGQEDLVPYTVPLTSLRVHDAMATNLPAVAANDDMALVTGTPGTDVPTLQGVDFGGASTDEKAAFEFVLPAEYVAGETITVRVRAAMLTTISDGTATVDVECWKASADGAAGSDLCATAAQSINSLTPANKDFTITPTGLAAGDRLLIRLSFGGSDTGNAGVMIPEISLLQVLLDIKG